MSDTLIYCHEAHFECVVEDTQRSYSVSIHRQYDKVDPTAERYTVIVLEPISSQLLGPDGQVSRQTHRIDNVPEWPDALDQGFTRAAHIEALRQVSASP